MTVWHTGQTEPDSTVCKGRPSSVLPLWASCPSNCATQRATAACKPKVNRQTANWPAALLKTKPELTQADLDNASVVVQGLSAYEYVLFDSSIDLADPTTRTRYCPLLTAIGEHQQQLAASVLQQWQDKDGNDKYSTEVVLRTCGSTLTMQLARRVYGLDTRQMHGKLLQMLGATWLELYGVSLLCGVGFTMSLFIGVLAFPGAVDSPEQVEVKLGVIGGSILSAVGAAVVLGLAGRRPRRDPAAADPQIEPLAGSSS